MTKRSSVRLAPLLAAAALAACLSPLHNAADRGDVPEIKRLVSAGADPNVVNDGVDRYTPLLGAVSHGRTDAVRALLQAGADPLFVTAWGTARQYAVQHGMTEIAQILKEAEDQKLGRARRPPTPPAEEPAPAEETRAAPAAAPTAKPWWQ